MEHIKSFRWCERNLVLKNTNVKGHWQYIISFIHWIDLVKLFRKFFYSFSVYSLVLELFDFFLKTIWGAVRHFEMLSLKNYIFSCDVTTGKNSCMLQCYINVNSIRQTTRSHTSILLIFTIIKKYNGRSLRKCR